MASTSFDWRPEFRRRLGSPTSRRGGGDRLHFPSLRIEHVYALLLVNPNHREQVEEYLCQEEVDAEVVRPPH